MGIPSEGKIIQTTIGEYPSEQRILLMGTYME